MKTSERCPFAAGSRVYTYLRHSPGDSQTIDSQEAAVRDWCSSFGLVLQRVFKDEAKTGATTVGREDFLSMVDALRDSDLKVRPAGIVLWSFSRFARDYDDAEFYKADLRRRGYVIYSLTDGIPEGPFGRVLESITHWKDEERLREISKDVKRGQRWLAEQGYSAGGFPPRGYKKSAPTEIGRKRNGEPRIAYRWEKDSRYESQVGKAWAMKLRGESNWDIHRATRLFKGINCYSTFFGNLTYAGYRKCGELLVEKAHAAYVTREEFDRVQASRQPAPRSRRMGTDPKHPRRLARDNHFLLSGLLFCGYCGAAMVGDKNKEKPFYACGTRERHGKGECKQRSIVAHYLHTLVAGWMASDVISLKHLLAARDDVAKRLGGSRVELNQKRALVELEIAKLNKGIKNLVDAVESRGITEEIASRLGERKTERAALETELGQIKEALSWDKIELSNEAVAYIARHLHDALLDGSPEDVKAVIRKVVQRIELFEGRLIVKYVTPLVRMSQNDLVGLERCPHGNSNPGFGLERATS